MLNNMVVQSSDGKIPMYWGIAADGSVVMSDELEIVKGGCGKSFAPFPTGMLLHFYFTFLQRISPNIYTIYCVRLLCFIIGR